MFSPRKNSAAKIMMCSLLSASTGGIVSAYLKPLIMGTYSETHRYDVGALTNGILAGLVSITGTCDSCEPWSAVLIGFIGSVFYTCACKLWQKIGIDDPIEASQVHAACGLWGLFAVGIFHAEKGLISSSTESLSFLGVQCMGALCIICWVSFFATSFFIIMKKLNLLRVPLVHEIIGLDITEMGSSVSIDSIIAQAIFRAHQQAMKAQRYK